ncbi:putative U-box domain-containing protein 33 [Iris pallida]|uniref:RING-type E3 ubiquitin transferase n=1 Tax=Iris pallida TaxID=29817 RepID=A0AAX6H7B5_IRIPA|nr:putative U-box domain-containing protein 33 [Iris pallida]
MDKKVVQAGSLTLEMEVVDESHFVIDVRVCSSMPNAGRVKLGAERPAVVEGSGRSTLRTQRATGTLGGSKYMEAALKEAGKLFSDAYQKSLTHYDVAEHSNVSIENKPNRYINQNKKTEEATKKSLGTSKSFTHYEVAEHSNVSLGNKPNRFINHNKKTEEATKKKSQETSNAEVEEQLPSSEVLGSSYKASSIPKFSFAEIKGATYDDLNKYAKIGEGRHWTVYEGRLGKTKVAIKKLAVETKQGESEFLGELQFLLSQLSHPNIVKLLGACFESQAVVYEFLPNGSLEDYFTKKRSPGLLTWQMRTRIVNDICTALIFLHNSKPNPVVHGNLKPSSVLLDEKYSCKLSNFGLSRFLPQSRLVDDAYHKTLPKGTLGYIDPEFVATGKLRPSSDVYSFGVTILRILTGMSATGLKGKVLDAYDEESEEMLMRMVDTTAGRWPPDVARKLASFGVKFCDEFEKSSKLLNEFSTELKAIIAKIGT